MTTTAAVFHGVPAGAHRPSVHAIGERRWGRGWLTAWVVFGLGAWGTTAGAQRGGVPAVPVSAASAVRDDSAGATNASCLACHRMNNLGYRVSAGEAPRSFTVSPETFHASVHGNLACAQCHPAATEFPHPAALAQTPVSCDGDCHATDSLGRPYTHQREAQQLASSVHGRTEKGDVPGCLTCHGDGNPHAVTRLSDAPPAQRMASCISCHDNQEMMQRHGVTTEAVTSYERSFHYKAIRFGDTHTAVCVDCHTAHHVLSPRDAASTVAASHLPQTCGQANCHPGAAMNFANSGANHLDLKVDQVWVLWAEENFFFVLTAGTMVMLLVGIVLDVQKKFNWLVLARRLGGWVAGWLRYVRRWIERSRPAMAGARRTALLLMRRVLYD